MIVIGWAFEWTWIKIRVFVSILQLKLCLFVCVLINSWCGWWLELILEQFHETFGDGLLIRSYGESIHLGLFVGLKTIKASILLSGCVDDAGSAKVLRIRINADQRTPPKANEILIVAIFVHFKIGFKNLLLFLARIGQILPTSKEWLGVHLRSIEELAQEDWQR